MPVKAPCEALILQYVHDVRSRERLNFGILLVCPQKRFVSFRGLERFGRIKAAFPAVNTTSLKDFCRGLHKLIAAQKNDQLCIDWEQERGAVAMFRKLIVPSDSAIEASDVLKGVTASPEQTLQWLYSEYVPQEPIKTRPREDGDVWTDFAKKLHSKNANILGKFITRRIEATHYEHTFKYVYKNGVYNIIQPLSFDLSEPDGIREKAVSWAGKINALELNKSTDSRLMLLIGDHSGEGNLYNKAHYDGVSILKQAIEGTGSVVAEGNTDAAIDKISTDLQLRN